MKDIFVSYSRERQPFARALTAAAQDCNISCWIDQSSIGPAEKWRSALREGILNANNFVVLLDRAWLDSNVCLSEYRLALEFGKTLIPVVIQEVSPAGWKTLGLAVPEELASRNYVWTHEKEFSEVVTEVVAAVHTDYDWKRLLNRLELRAQRWRSSDENIGLLRGQELVGVHEAVALAHGKEPAMTEAVSEFIQASQREEFDELEKQRERTRQAESRSLAADSARLRIEEPVDSLNLAGQAWQLAPSIDALRALGQWYESHPHLIGTWPMNFAISGLALAETSFQLASCELFSSLVLGDQPSQRLIVQDLRDLGKIDSLTDIEGFGGCAWAGGKLTVLRRSHIISYRYDPFKERFRQSTRGVEVPNADAPMIPNPSGTLVALPKGANGLIVYSIGSDRAVSYPTKGHCLDAAWIDDTKLLVTEGGGLSRRDLEGWDDDHELIPRNRGVVSVDASGEDWIALSYTDRALLYREGAQGEEPAVLHNAPDPATGVCIGSDRTAFVFGGGGGTSPPGISEVDVRSGQTIREWLGGFHTAVTAFDSGQGKWLAAGRRDGLVLLWSRDSTNLETTDCEPPPTGTRVDARVLQVDMLSQELRVRAGEGDEYIAELPSLGNFPVLPGAIPGVVREGLLCVGYGADLLWFDLDGDAQGPVATSAGHTNPVGHLACSPVNTLWVSTAMSALNNSVMELFAWDRRSPEPVLKLFLPWFNCSGITFDQSGQTLLLLDDGQVAKSFLMDPDQWIKRGERMRQMGWSRAN